MLSRCRNSNNKDFANYGGRGITVCERWLTFENFLADMGERPSPKHTIDRYPNNDGNYEPGNCRWATTTEQNRNRRSTRMTPDSVRTARAAYEGGTSIASIARRFDVSENCATRVVKHTTWQDVQ